jgi:hypothetical protein
MKMNQAAATAVFLFLIFHPVFGFEGRLTATLARRGQIQDLLYTVGTNSLRVEMTATNWPNPVDILDRNSGGLTLLFPNNRSFVRLKNSGAGVPPARFDAGRPGIYPQPTGGTPLPPPPGMPAMPPGVGPQTAPGQPGMPAMPMMPMMPPPMLEPVELKATGDTTNLRGLPCERFEITQRGETMEVWATDQLFPFQPYVQNQPHRYGIRMIEEQWPELVKAKKLFPLLATSRFDNGTERFRFEVKSIRPQELTDEDAKLFQPPASYFEIQPLPF